MFFAYQNFVGIRDQIQHLVLRYRWWYPYILFLWSELHSVLVIHKVLRWIVRKQW